MSFEFFVALRYLLTCKKHHFISAISLMSILGVALGVAALIVVLGVMNGFGNNLRDKILGVNAHLIVSSVKGSFGDYQLVADRIRGLEEVKGAMPFIYSEVMLSTAHGVKGAALRGIEPQTANEVLSLGEDLIQGKLLDLSQKHRPPGLILGKAMADRLGVGLQSQVFMLTPSGMKTAAGFSPKIETYQVKGVFDTGMYEYDSSLVYINLQDAQRILGFKGDLVTGLEVSLDDVFAAKEVKKEIKALLNSTFMVQTWMEMNRSLFSALNLEKTAMGVILAMIILVGSFSIITTLIMLVMEKRQDIAVLMSMGCKPENIRKIFMYQGIIIGLIGTFLGFVAGGALSYFLEKYQFIPLPEGVYPMDHLSVQLQTMDLVIIGVAALVLCFLATLYPARHASRLQPAEVLRYE